MRMKLLVLFLALTHTAVLCIEDVGETMSYQSPPKTLQQKDTETKRTSVSYNERVSLDQARMSQIAYCPVTHIQNAAEQRFIRNVSIIQSKDMHIVSLVGLRDIDEGYIQNSDVYDTLKQHRIVQVVFRGTNGLDTRNWITNFDSRLIPFKYSTDREHQGNDNTYTYTNMHIHEGFVTAFAQIEETLYRAVEDLLKSSSHKRSVYVTGHSLGGALALIAAMRFKERYPGVDVFLTTFGSPRVGDYEFTRYVQDLIGGVSFRVTHGYDIVPHLPMQIQGYTHANTEIWYNNDFRGYKTCNWMPYSQDITESFLQIDVSDELKNDKGMQLMQFLATEMLKQKENQDCANSVIPRLSLDQHRYYMGFDITDIETCSYAYTVTE